MQHITEIHEEVHGFLSNQEQLFSLRKRNRDGMLDERHRSYGNDNYLAASFWLQLAGDCWLAISTKAGWAFAVNAHSSCSQEYYVRFLWLELGISEPFLPRCQQTKKILVDSANF